MSRAESTADKATQQFAFETFLLAQSAARDEAHFRSTLKLAVEMASEGDAIPPLGFLADLDHLLSRLQSPSISETNTEPNSAVGGEETATCRWDSALVRRYEDYVVGKLLADPSIERAADALPQYKDRDRDRAVAYAAGQILKRSGWNGPHINPALLKGVMNEPASKLQADLMEAAAQPIDTTWVELVNDFISRFRSLGECLGGADIFELERGTAVSGFGNRLALRQILETAESYELQLPKQRPKSRSSFRSVATQFTEEDQYPIGGFSSISNRGTLESLLRSELAYIEDDQRPDLFDIRYVRDELLYYSRDENQFLRRRMTFQFILASNLDRARIKDAGATVQRLIQVLAAIVAAVRRIRDWLGNEALRFEIIIEETSTPTLIDEIALLQILFREEIENGELVIVRLQATDVAKHCESTARTCLCLSTTFAVTTNNPLNGMIDLYFRSPSTRPIARPILCSIVIDSPYPRLRLPDQAQEDDDPEQTWPDALSRLFGVWI